MKNLVLFLILVSTASCNKKEPEKDPVPAPPPVVVPAGRANIMSAKVNGESWSVKDNNTSKAKIEVTVNAGPPKQYVFTGTPTTSVYQKSIFIFTPCTTGTVDLRSTPGCSAIYFDNSGHAYYIKTGTMTITAFDTSHVKSPICDKFKATFSFVTDSSQGTAYNIQDGLIDFEAP